MHLDTQVSVPVFITSAVSTHTHTLTLNKTMLLTHCKRTTRLPVKLEYDPSTMRLKFLCDDKVPERTHHLQKEENFLGRKEGTIGFNVGGLQTWSDSSWPFWQKGNFFKVYPFICSNKINTLTLRTILLSEVGVLPTHRANLQGSPSTCSVTPSSDVWGGEIHNKFTWYTNKQDAISL